MNNIKISVPVVLTLDEARELYYKLKNDIIDLENHLSSQFMEKIYQEFSEEYLSNLSIKISKFAEKLSQSNFPLDVCDTASFSYENHRVTFLYSPESYRVHITRIGNVYLPNSKQIHYKDEYKEMLKKCLIIGLKSENLTSWSGPNYIGVVMKKNAPKVIQQIYFNEKNNKNKNGSLSLWLTGWDK